MKIIWRTSFLILFLVSLSLAQGIEEQFSDFEKTREISLLQNNDLNNMLLKYENQKLLFEKDTLSSSQKNRLFLSVETGFMFFFSGKIPGWFFGVSVGIPIGNDWYFNPKYCRSDMKLFSDGDKIGKGHEWIFLFGKKTELGNFRILPKFGFGIYNEWENLIRKGGLQYHDRDFAINLELDAGYRILPKTYISLDFRIHFSIINITGINYLSIGINRDF